MRRLTIAVRYLSMIALAVCLIVLLVDVVMQKWTAFVGDAVIAVLVGLVLTLATWYVRGGEPDGRRAE